MAIANNHFSDNPFCDNFNDAINQYACLADHAAEGAKLSYQAGGVTLTSAQITTLKAIEVMNLVQNTASSARYAYLMRTQSAAVKSTLMDNQTVCLEKGFGICGTHQHLFIAILKAAGVKARPVDFYFSLNNIPNNHAAAEVQIAPNQWAYFDISWASFWLKTPQNLLALISIEDILSGKGTKVTGNNSWYIAMSYGLQRNKQPSIFSYLKAPDLQILKSKGGLLKIHVTNNKADFSTRPNYFGKTQDNAPLTIQLTGMTKPGTAILDISAIGGDCKQSSIKVGSQHYPVVIGKTTIAVLPNATFNIEGKDTICYAVINALTIRDSV